MKDNRRLAAAYFDARRKVQLLGDARVEFFRAQEDLDNKRVGALASGRVDREIEGRGNKEEKREDILRSMFKVEFERVRQAQVALFLAEAQYTAALHRVDEIRVLNNEDDNERESTPLPGTGRVFVPGTGV